VTTDADILLREKDLLSRISQGDEAAFTEVFYRYGQRVWWFIFKRTKSRSIADEIVQEVFMKLWVRKEDASGIGDLQSYIYTMAVNKTYDHFKKVASDSRKLEHLWHRMKEMAAPNVVEEMVDFRESQEIVNQAIQQLPPQRKKIYQLHRIEGLSYEEIADMLHISKSTVSSQLVEAAKFIREYVKGAGGTAVIFLLLTEKFYL
jgi:RNA polymerase sigma-70 factor (family 1)